jgi:ABC-type Fe3+ transport system substrate-binding protein
MAQGKRRLDVAHGTRTRPRDATLRWMAVAALAAAPSALAAGVASAAEFSPAMQQLIAAADKEGQLSLVWSQSSLGGSTGAARFEAGINQMFATKIKIKHTPGPSMPAVGNELVLRDNAGQPAQTDVYLAFSRDMAELADKHIFRQAAWTDLLPGRLTAAAVEADGTAVKLITSLAGVTINTQLAPDKPQRLADFLTPAWTGKIATTPYSAGFDILASSKVWGGEKALDFARKLSPQIAGLTRCDENERLASGEFVAMLYNCTGTEDVPWAAKGAPLVNSTPVDYPVMSYFYFAVPKRAVNPNAGTLFVAFAATPEGQKIVRETWYADLHLYPESEAKKKVARMEAADGTKLVDVDLAWQHDNTDGRKVHTEINKILAVKK